MRRAEGGTVERPGFLAAGPVPGRVRDSPDMGLARRLALLTAVITVALVLGATEVALRWSERSRLDDRRRESVELATSWSEYLSRVAPQGERDAITQALSGWPSQHLSVSDAAMFVWAGRRARARRVQRHQQDVGTDAQRLAGDGQPPAAGAIRDRCRTRVERGDASGGARPSVRRTPRQCLHGDAARLGPARAAAGLRAGPDRGAARGRGGGLSHVDLGRRSAQHPGRRDGGRARGRGERTGSARAGTRGIPPPHPALQRTPRGAHRTATGKRRTRGAPGAGGTRPQPRSPGAAGGDGHRLRARDRHATQHRERSPSAPARRPEARGAARGGGPGAAAAGPGGPARRHRAGTARSRRMAGAGAAGHGPRCARAPHAPVPRAVAAGSRRQRAPRAIAARAGDGRVRPGAGGTDPPQPAQERHRGARPRRQHRAPHRASRPTAPGSTWPTPAPASRRSCSSSCSTHSSPPRGRRAPGSGSR